MGSRTRLVIALLAALVAVGLLVPGADARATAVQRVSGLGYAGQDWANAKLKVKWRKVAGARYQVRWAPSTAKLSVAKRYATAATAAYSPTLSNRCVPWYVQVRAVKAGRVGAWSAAKGLRFSNKIPAAPQVSATPLVNSIRFSWSKVLYGARYRIHWSPAPSGKWPVTNLNTPWTTGTSAVLNLPTTPVPGDRFMGTAYANAVYFRVEVDNGCVASSLRWSQPYQAAYPLAPDPGTGDDLRFATYNLEHAPTAADEPARINAIAQNIVDQAASGAPDIKIMVLQEASATTATDLIAALAAQGQGDWTAADAGGAAQQILYRSTDYSWVAGGTFGVAVPPADRSVPVLTPWAQLHPTTPDVEHGHQDLFVVAPHLQQTYDAPTSDAQRLTNKHNAGLSATYLLEHIESTNSGDLPVIAAGDLRYLREPWGEVAGSIEAPPTFVRGLGPGEGFFDALAARTKVNIGFTTVNGHLAGPQPVGASGVGTRADYIMLKGFLGSRKYVNVANKTFPGLAPEANGTPSDHNLVYADLVIAFKP